VLDDLWIEPGLRGRGLARRLLGAALADMVRSGAQAVIVESDPAGAPTMAFYGRLGFHPKGTVLLARALDAASNGTR
jgi:ribosomal protein S18 acetylase RimI-like enzyme